MFLLKAIDELKTATTVYSITTLAAIKADE